MTFNVLSIDGGGLRGIIPGLILTELEKKLQHYSHRPDARLCDFFDLIAGTSTGAILGASYLTPDHNGRPKFTAADAVSLYQTRGGAIFNRSTWRKITTLGGLLEEKYSAHALEKILLRQFGEIDLASLLKPCCFVSYDIVQRKPKVFKQHTASIEGNNFRLIDVLRSTAAAPTYFEAAQVTSIDRPDVIRTFIDGGIVANDPALCAYSEALKFPEVRGIADMMIVSLGTGQQLQSYTYQDVKGYGPLRWAQPVINIALDGGPQMAEYHLKGIDSTTNTQHVYRLQPELFDASPEMDNATPDNLDRLTRAGELNCEAFATEIDRIAKRLIAHKHELN
ncbi:MAG: patatin-like phospholipase family protein [Gammaproteobacteria bacterium]|nr:patatin-like phospholipase family protein [Gammaproteobacteria bacterium]